VNRLQLILIPALLISVSVIFAFPELVKKLNIGTFRNQLYLALAIIVIFIFCQSLIVLRPLKQFERFEKRKLHLLDEQAEPFIKKHNQWELRINVMLLERRFRVFGRYFKTVWMCEDMKYDTDAHLRLSLEQGVCGYACREGGVWSADLTVEKPEEYGLSQKQIKKTQDIKFIISCPIKELDANTFRLTDKIIGAVNIDSKKDGSEVWVNDEEDLRGLTSKAKAISDLSSMLF
jgi:hypothetical protein